MPQIGTHFSCEACLMIFDSLIEAASCEEKHRQMGIPRYSVGKRVLWKKFMADGYTNEIEGVIIKWQAPRRIGYPHYLIEMDNEERRWVDQPHILKEII